ncbi:translation initiation factor IF-3 [Candidatus Uhrbacteria bacterium RIFOXYB12_FULL_58_10]|uniref:Translation initiation factor IF-3 n=1 Tax=Candidatus Uhrbacteria bacterium RIFOXYB2_FULL_57_15 TaxID=1802422 RepID=A0A1F7W6F3_9BACT|nr:MAG: translation initiation factor IF-3 [Candidatus Uhrbacteria bacterium RIFOXYB12_FULL_58_10]OGL98349.1 MAG: translation initiation factor IF-3 [Candidatus Uhrbacteria bacterium RIFOXYB2_FULL_57_15]OGM00196.1 MAG: translation initiation factor IF-3 [Candidatus Uhrbacteria bacterium RIFOXYC12_FULL_57_11]
MRIHRRRHQKPKLNIPTFRVNEQIDNPDIRVIDDKGEQLGVIPTAKALELARSRELDLVEVSPKAEPPVCKILDFGHFKYQKEKEVRKQKAQSHEVEIKGIRLSLRIGDHDLDIRRQQARKFFERGDKVKIELRLRGRERAHVDVAKGVVARFLELAKQDFPIRVEQPVQVMGGTITMILARG